MTFTPVVRFRNFYVKNIEPLLSVYPDMATKMNWDDATDSVTAQIPSYKKTAYQMACQLGWENRSTTEFKLNSYIFSLDDVYLEKYLEFWTKTYYAPNPYVNSPDTPRILYCEIADAIIAAPTHEIDYDAYFATNIGGGNEDILRNAISANGDPIKQKKVGTVHYLYVLPADVNKLKNISDYVKTNFPIPGTNDKEHFFNRYSYENFMRFHGFNGRKLAYHSGYVASSGFDRNRIVFGAPGTGKSYRINKDKDRLLAGKVNNFERVTFFGDYTYSQFVGTYKPLTDNSTGEIKYKFVPGPFMRILAKAYKNIYQASDVATGNINQANIEPFVLLIEEINRAKAATVFGDIFQLLDRKKLTGESQYEIHPSKEIREYLAEEVGNDINCYETIKIPDNLFIWASMNSADQGVFPIDTAFKRRWSFEYIGIDDEEFGMEPRTPASSGLRVKATDVSGKWVPSDPNVPGEFMINTKGPYKWNVLRRAINAKLSSDSVKVHEDKLLGPFFLNTKDEQINPANSQFIDNEAFLRAFESKVLMYLFEDAVKTRRDKFFYADENRYSVLCEKFRTDGLAVFGSTFETQYYRTQESEMQDKINQR